MTLKLLFDPETGRVLGAQAVGGAGVDKRIDVLAVAIQAGMTVFDLEEAELAYSPQYGSAKDPINMAGFVAAGLLRGDHPQIDVEAVLNAPTDQLRSCLTCERPRNSAAGHIPGAVNIPVDELRSRLGELPRDRRSPPTARSASAATWRPAFCSRRVFRLLTSVVVSKLISSSALSIRLGSEFIDWQVLTQTFTFGTGYLLCIWRFDFRSGLALR